MVSRQTTRLIIIHTIMGMTMIIHTMRGEYRALAIGTIRIDVPGRPSPPEPSGSPRGQRRIAWLKCTGRVGSGI
jgi:hypothetical protein